MIELLTANTPNGKKISIMLEEINFKYKVTKINIDKDEQFKTEFTKFCPINPSCPVTKIFIFVGCHLSLLYNYLLRYQEC